MIQIETINTRGFVRLWTEETESYTEAIEAAIAKVLESPSKSPPIEIIMKKKEGGLFIY